MDDKKKKEDLKLGGRHVGGFCEKMVCETNCAINRYKVFSKKIIN